MVVSFSPLLNGRTFMVVLRAFLDILDFLAVKFMSEEFLLLIYDILVVKFVSGADVTHFLKIVFSRWKQPYI